MRAYTPRLVDKQLQILLEGLAAVNVEGARGVGKTRTAQEHAATFIPLDDPEERQHLMSLGRNMFRHIATPMVLDEWQLMPEIWDRVRRAVDDDPTPGRFILTGSASPTQAPVHTGAGRIVNLRMRPMTLVERGMDQPIVSLKHLLSGRQDTPIEGSTKVALGDYVQEILCSGLPGIRDLSSAARRAQLDAYIDQTTRHDLSDGTTRRARSLKDWLAAYAASVSTTASFTEIARLASKDLDAPVAATTTRGYRDLLESMWVLDPLRGWSPSENEFARITTSDKHQLCDPALAARLLNLDADALLGTGLPTTRPTSHIPRRARMLGPLFESLVTQSVQVYAALCNARVSHLRTKAGAQEVDLIVEGPGRQIVAIEVKTTATPRPGDTKHLLWLRQRLGERLADAVVITTGRYAYRDEDGIAVIPAALLGP
ncbi:Uncharacterised protein [Actinomyces bovis]|uniref:ATP-binding protein n=1 Tax=Actinomyces bovis TaxID=1658 RepID=A0ABY1VQM0_9ACTO|nr:AAA family ATPase [Actinomyces bovis]SPT54419.1 Uncharacterised protein [Actinomyces bovis]VEG55996.1 Uncharacterised protein [Actinomyces israelii]